jgi:hypothetical protein
MQSVQVYYATQYWFHNETMLPNKQKKQQLKYSYFHGSQYMSPDILLSASNYGVQMSLRMAALASQ